MWIYHGLVITVHYFIGTRRVKEGDTQLQQCSGEETCMFCYLSYRVVPSFFISETETGGKGTVYVGCFCRWSRGNHVMHIFLDIYRTHCVTT